MFTERFERVLAATPRVGGVALKLEKIITLLFVSLFALAVLRNAWLYDDAYITFRTVDNFVNGYGLTWNTAERVQTYTHPLWMFLVSAVYVFTHEMFYSSLFLCVAVSVAAVLLFAFGIAESAPAAWLGLTLLTFSKAFVDYSTSGLENPLTHLILAVFVCIYGQTVRQADDLPAWSLKRLFWLAVIAALGTLNRMDTLLFFLPALGYAWLLAAGGPKNILRLQRSGVPKFLPGLVVMMLGFAPVMMWEGFALFYYGVPFPNTAYAKLNTAVDSWALVQQGLYYLLNSLQIDPLTLFVIAAGLIAPLVTKKWSYLPLAAGVALYLLYVVRIGGDFMTGRFLTGSLFVAVILLTQQVSEIRYHASRFTIPAWLALLGVALLVGLNSPYPPLLVDVNYGLNFEREELRDQGIQDGRGIYYQYSGLLNGLQNPGVTWPNHAWSVEGREARANGPAVIVRGAIGFFGFYAGPQVHIVDHWALADPLLARLPAALDWQIGHFTRGIPGGYLETLQSGQNQIHHKNLAAFYDKLSLITRGALFDPNRLIEIWRLNTGQYEALLATYPPIFQVNLADPVQPTAQTDQPMWSHSNNLTDYAGIRLNLGRLSYANRMEISLVADRSPGEPAGDEQRNYRLIYCQGERAVADQDLQVPAQIPAKGLVRVIAIPEAAALQGYDNIRVFPKRGDALYSTIYRIERIRLLE